MRPRCAGTPAAWWLQPEGTDAARATCGLCPLREDCATTAIVEGDWATYRGGMTPDERKTFAKQVGEARHGTVTGYTKDRCRCHLCRLEMAEAKRASNARRKETR